MYFLAQFEGRWWVLEQRFDGLVALRGECRYDGAGSWSNEARRPVDLHEVDDINVFEIQPYEGVKVYPDRLVWIGSRFYFRAVCNLPPPGADDWEGTESAYHGGGYRKNIPFEKVALKPVDFPEPFIRLIEENAPQIAEAKRHDAGRHGSGSG